jgi:hypothetical protein
LFNPEKLDTASSLESSNYEIIDAISGASMFITGILLALVRLYEPFFVFLIK